MRRLIFISLVLITQVSFGQFTQQYNQYMFNGLSINPAYTGVRECLSITGIHSNQWTGFKGAPVMNSLTAHSPFKKAGAFGVNIYSDNIGNQQQTGVYGSYAYHLKINRKSKLSFGINAGLSFFDIRDKDVVLVNENDNAFNINTQMTSFPNIGTGLFYYKDDFYAGISVPALFSSEYSNVAIRNYFNIDPSALVLFQTAGGILRLTNDLDWKPSYLLKVIPNVSMALDLNSNFYYKEKINFGVSYRIKKAFIAMAGITIKQKFDIGYSFSFPLSDVVNFNAGTHEIMMRFELREIVSSVNPRLY